MDNMRGGFMMRARDRGGLMRPGFPLRGRGVMVMDRVRLVPHRPALMRGPHPAFVGRPMLPQGRPRGVGPGMIGRPPMPPPGAMGPLVPRGMMHPPRPMLPHRALVSEGGNAIDPFVSPAMSINHTLKGNNQFREEKEGNGQNKGNHANHPVGARSNSSNCTNTSNNNIHHHGGASNNDNTNSSNNCTNNINTSNTNNRDNRNNRVGRVNQVTMTYPQISGQKKNRKDFKSRRGMGQSSQPMPIPMQPVAQTSRQPPLQNLHPTAVPPHSQQSLQPASVAQQNVVCMNPPPIQNHMHPGHAQPQNQLPTIGGGGGGPGHGVGPPPPSSQMSMQPPAFRGRNGPNHRNRGNAHIGNRVNLVMNHGPNVSVPISPRNAMMNGPPPPSSVQYSAAPPPSYHVPPPSITSQIPMKRGVPPPVVAPPPTAMPPPPKRIRYEPPPAPANGYLPVYQQPPPQPQQQQQLQQTTYPASYDMPPPHDVYSNAPPPQPSVNANMICPAPQTYNNTADYCNYQTAPPQTSHAYGISSQQQQQPQHQQQMLQQQPPLQQQYSNSSMYSNNAQSHNQSYTGYTSTSVTGYDPSLDYSSMQVQQPMSTTDAYGGYSKPVSSVDSYSYSNVTYAPSQTCYDDYSSTYVDNSSAYSQPIPDETYGQSVGTYSSYSY